MNVQPAVVDSSGWIEVFKWVLREHSEAQAIQAVAATQRGQLVNPDTSLAIAADQLSHSLCLPMTGSIILATARLHQARLYTMHTDFQGLNDVELIARNS